MDTDTGAGCRKKVLFINACVNRDSSRTCRLARELISRFPDSSIDEIILEESGITGLDSEKLGKRNRAVSEGNFNDPMFDYARLLISADVVVMASPFWDGMFNTFLKAFLENVSVPGLVFSYNEHGIPVGNAKGELYYVTTRGGPVTDENDPGCMIIKVLGSMYGFRNTTIISADSLDIVGNDPEKILSEKIRTIDDFI